MYSPLLSPKFILWSLFRPPPDQYLPTFLALQADPLPDEPQGSPIFIYQFSPVAQLCPTLQPHESQHARPPCPSPTWSSLRLTSIESVMPFSHLILCHPLLLLPPIPPSIRVFSNESTLRIRWPKYWSFSFSIIPSKVIPGLISFTMDWLDLLAVCIYTGPSWVLRGGWKESRPKERTDSLEELRVKGELCWFFHILRRIVIWSLTIVWKGELELRLKKWTDNGSWRA